MRFREIGQMDQPALVFIHGLSATAESCYGTVAPHLEKDWRMILCELDGHYPDSPVFSGIEKTCVEIEAYVNQHLNGTIYGLIGLSLGGTIAVSLLGRGNITVKRTLLDAAFCIDMGIMRGFYTWVFPLGVARMRDGKYVPGFLIDILMGKGNRSVIEMLYPGIQKETCRNACREVYAYRIPAELKDTDSAVEFWRGSDEKYPQKSAALLKNLLPEMTERVFPSMGHCQFLHEHPDEYAELLDGYMKGKASCSQH